MLIKKAKYKKVRVWESKLVSQEVHGCDKCKTPIGNYPNEPQRLELSVWEKKDSHETKNYHFCSWKCLLNFIPTIKSEYFASMPFLYFDEGNGKRTANELIKIIRKLLPKQNYR